MTNDSIPDSEKLDTIRRHRKDMESLSGMIACLRDLEDRLEYNVYTNIFLNSEENT